MSVGPVGPEKFYLAGLNVLKEEELIDNVKAQTLNICQLCHNNNQEIDK